MFGVGGFFFAQIGKFLERYDSLGDDEEDEDMKEAGIDDLKIFKHYNLIDNLASSIETQGDFMAIPTERVYMKLLRNQMKATIQKEYERVKKRKLG